MACLARQEMGSYVYQLVRASLLLKLQRGTIILTKLTLSLNDCYYFYLDYSFAISIVLITTHYTLKCQPGLRKRVMEAAALLQD